MSTTTSNRPTLPLAGEGRGESDLTSTRQASHPTRVLLSPLSRQPLHPDTPHTIAAPGERWPVIEGIPFLRTNRDALVADAIHLLDEGHEAEATVLLLGDQDDWARTPPPSRAERESLLRDVDRVTFREAMDRLAFGPVGTYFAHRWSDPTFLSGLALAEAHWIDPASVFELACGAGHYLREFVRFCPDVAGADVVFAKLWLARRFVAPTAQLLCFDAAQPWPLPDRAADMLFCHDAFYFLPEKPHVAAEMRRVATGPILVGHAHNGLVDNLSSGAPLSPSGYAALFDSPALFDDTELTDALVENRAPLAVAADGLARAAAISLAANAPAARPVTAGLAMPPQGAALRRNPLYVDGMIQFPSDRYEKEYGKLASYPMRADAKVDDPVRRRVLLDLPERW